MQTGAKDTHATELPEAATQRCSQLHDGHASTGSLRNGDGQRVDTFARTLADALAVARTRESPCGAT